MIHRIINKITCLINGHIPYVYEEWYTWITLNRKGGKKHGKGVYKKKHKKYYCARCGKFLKKT